MRRYCYLSILVILVFVNFFVALFGLPELAKTLGYKMPGFLVVIGSFCLSMGTILFMMFGMSDDQKGVFTANLTSDSEEGNDH